MNLSSARNRLLIVEGLTKRVQRVVENVDEVLPRVSVWHDLNTIVRQCQLLALDLEEPRAVNKDTGTLSGNRRE